MDLTFGERLRHAWDVFRNRDSTTSTFSSIGPASYTRPDRPLFSYGNEQSIIGPILNRIAVDASQIDIRHVRLDERGRYLETIDSGLNSCLSLSANSDQTGRTFIHDVVLSMLDEGVVAVVPTVTDLNPRVSDSYQIKELRVGKVEEWHPKDIKVSLYNEEIGQKTSVLLPKKMVAVIENPFYSVMNGNSSLVKRLVNKLNQLDAIDNQSSSGKLDLIIQLPYAITNERKRLQAETRRKDIEDQLEGSKYGIAYTDATEHVTQLNRSLTNNMMDSIEYLTGLLYGQLGMTQEIMNGTANEEAMKNYYSRTIEPIVMAVVEAMNWKFLTKTARTQGQAITYFYDQFKFVPYESLAESVNTLVRNEVLTANEFRQVLGMRPADEPKADQLRNPNIKDNVAEPPQVPTEQDISAMSEEEIMAKIAQFDEDDAELDRLQKELDSL